MSVSTIDNYLSSYTDTYSNSSTKATGLQDKLSGDLSKASDDELMSVCKEFEAYFTEQAFKAMQKMVPESEDKESNSGASTLDMFKDNLVQQYASSATQGEGLGLAKMLYEQMKRNYSL